MKHKDSVQEKRAFVIQAVAVLLFFTFPVLTWLEMFLGHSSDGLSLPLRVGLTLLSMCAGGTWLVLNQRYPSLLNWLVDMSDAQQKRFDTIAFHITTPLCLVGIEWLLYEFSLHSLHTSPFTRTVLLVVVALAVLLYWLVGTFSPQSLEHLVEKHEDYAINVLICCMTVMFAWLVLPGVEALCVTALALLWVFLIRKVAWIPRYRSGTSPQKERSTRS